MEITNSGLKKGRVVDKSQQDYHICSVVANWVALPPAQSTRHILNTHTNTRKGKRQELGSAPRLSACDQGSQESRQCGRPQGSTPPAISQVSVTANKIKLRRDEGLWNPGKTSTSNAHHLLLPHPTWIPRNFLKTNTAIRTPHPHHPTLSHSI